MSQRRLYLDSSAGERRGVVTLDGRPERLLIDRDSDVAAQALGARVVARIRQIERAAGLAFLELSEGPDAVLNITSEVGRLVEGQCVEVEIRSEARRGKGATVQFLAPADGAPRLLAPGPSLEARLRAYDQEADIQHGPVARSVADGAQEEALTIIHPLPGGGSVAIETTRALVAVDVDLGARPGTETKRAARAANFTALGAGARLLRLKGLGGLVVFDLIGRGHDGPALLSAARAAFAADNPGVALGPISRFGALELTIPRRARPALDRLTDESGDPSLATIASDAIRALEREALADGGGRFELAVSRDVCEIATVHLATLVARFGGRLSLRADIGLARGAVEVRRI